MRRESETVAWQGDLRGVEGTRVVIIAESNQPLESAWIYFDCDGSRDLKLKVGASDLARWWLSEPAPAYSWVFGMEALMFAWSAWWAVQVGRGAAVQTRKTQTAPWAMEGQQP
jgi:hypothetical protein